MRHYNPNSKPRHIRKYHKTKRDDEEWAKHDSIKDMKIRQFIKRQLINSKGPYCGICGKEITDMKDCTIDHIKPRAKGGLTTLDNCQLAHKECNRLKGDQQFDQHQI